MAFGNGLDAALTGWWFRDRLGRPIELDRIQEVVQLLAGLLLILQPLGTAIGMGALILTGMMPPHRQGGTAAACYSANLYAEFIAGQGALEGPMGLGGDLPARALQPEHLARHFRRRDAADTARRRTQAPDPAFGRQPPTGRRLKGGLQKGGIAGNLILSSRSC